MNSIQFSSEDKTFSSLPSSTIDRVSAINWNKVLDEKDDEVCVIESSGKKLGYRVENNIEGVEPEINVYSNTTCVSTIKLSWVFNNAPKLFAEMFYIENPDEHKDLVLEYARNT